jgi:hypothetical protein
MKAARIRLILASAAFLGWLGWLAVAVAQKGKTDIVSRAQLVEATMYVVAEVTADGEGLPNVPVKVVKSLKAPLPGTPETIEVINIRKATVPGKPFPGSGTYLIPVVMQGPTTFTVAGLPRSPGYEAATPDRPAIYPWTDDTKKQLQKLGIEP